jgi:exodeoxyribonuclease-5
MLLAPTGRAAKVLSVYSGRKAFTIHKIIYKLSMDESGELKFKRVKNYNKNMIFMIDEASMIYDNASSGSASLLKDLTDYIFEHPSNKMVIIGDTAQLPPVGHLYSGALDKNNLELKYMLNVKSIELTDVVRQEKESGILHNATQLRINIKEEQTHINIKTNTFDDTFKMNSLKMEDGLRYSYDKYGIEDTIIICQSNKQTIMYNQMIRRLILFYDNEIDTGDYLMIVKNNYFWLEEDSPAGFLANGDFAEILKISNFEEKYGYKFADLNLRLVDYEDHPTLYAKAILNTLYTPSPALTTEESRAFYDEIASQYEGIPKIEFKKAMAEDPYLNALQIKFTYAITCHKSQGGQWSSVFIDQGYIKDDTLDTAYLRWLYTAITRATKELFFVNFHDNFFLS